MRIGEKRWIASVPAGDEGVDEDVHPPETHNLGLDTGESLTPPAEKYQVEV
ncbi:MAG: hypothetical protein Kow0088_19110 [Anaerolineales bacterium]